MQSASNRLYRNSASLIVLARNHQLYQKNGFNYKVLSFKRTEKTSFMANHIVFPGGACESSDQSKEWLNHFKKYGITDNRLEEITKVYGDRPPIFQTQPNDQIKREISLRITAIRETFEELGILICRTKDQVDDNSLFGKFSKNIEELKLWQELVHNDSTKFLELCQKLEVIPDLWSLYEWSVWKTPSVFKRRFETAFFVVALNEIPLVIPEYHEVASYYWKDPKEYLFLLREEQIFLPPPQAYECSRILKYSDITELIEFAKQRNDKGTTLFLPAQYRCSDGMAGVLPGDDFYPSDPNDIVEPIDHSSETLEQFRLRTNKLHRSEHRSMFNTRYFLNFKPFNEHLSPVLEDDANAKL